MDRHSYVQILQSANYELMGLTSEWMTDDGEYLDDEVNDELQSIIIGLDQFIEKLKAKVPA